MSERKDKVIPKKGNKTSTEMLLDPTLTGGYRRVRRRSALDDEFEAEEDAQARKLRELRVEEMTVKREARIAKLRREIEEPPVPAKAEGETKFSGISINTARQIAALPEEERTRVLETYMLMQAAEAKQANAVLPAIVGFARANPGSSPNQFMEFAKAMSDQFRTGVEVAQKMAPPQQDQWKAAEIMMNMVKETKSASDETWKPVELVLDLVKTSVKEPIEKLEKSMQPQPGFFEHLLMNPELFDRAKELGMFGRPSGGAGTSDLDLKIEELRSANQLEIKKLDLEWRKSLLEREASDKKTDAVLTALAPLTAIAAGPVGQRMRQFGQQQASAHNPANPSDMPPRVTPMPNTILVQCSCGYQGPTSFSGNTPPATINCPQCGLALNVGDVPIAGKPEETGTGT